MKYSKKIGAIVFLASFYSFAGIDLRVGGGLNLSNEAHSGGYTLASDETKKMHVGFNAGAQADIHLSTQMGVVAGLSYETRGSQTVVDAGSPYFDPNASPQVFSLRYLQIPVLFSYRPIPALSIAIGPELGIFLDGELKLGNSVSGPLDEIRTIDFGASLLVDYTFANMIAVGAGYYLGLLNNDASSTADILSGGIKNNNIKLYVAYVFHL
jgi:hypothetical protein